MKGGVALAYNIMCVRIGARREISPKVQQVLAEYGCHIRVRLGLHDVGDECTDDGLLVLQLTGKPAELRQLELELNDLASVQAQMVSL